MWQKNAITLAISFLADNSHADKIRARGDTLSQRERLYSGHAQALGNTEA